MKIIKTEINHKDERGVIMDLIENRVVNAVTYISIKKGFVRANHYHKQTTQFNYIIKGQVKLVTQFGDSPKEELILFPGDIAYTEPMEKHALQAVEDCEMLVFTEGPRGGKEYESDTFRLEESLI